MKMYDIIINKRDGKAITKKQINFFIENYVKGNIPEYQASALLMAMYINGLSKQETIDLTYAMAKSGEMVDLSQIQGIKVDKHSTGGVGDKTSLVIGPIVASCGVPFAKMSGRSLGHTGGTIDKLESIPGFKVDIAKQDFIKNVNENKISIISQSENIAPADKKIYALRDAIAAVDNIPLIASSIMSKKLALGSDCILLDVKVGDGAFIKDLSRAVQLAKIMVEIGEENGKHTVALITDMNQPLGKAVGNSVEVAEAIDTLLGKGPEDLTELCIELSAQMILMAGAAHNLAQAKYIVKQSLTQHKAAKKFEEFVLSQGGSIYIDNYQSALYTSKYKIPVMSQQEGYIKKFDTYRLAMIIKNLGAGRDKKEAKIDHSVGLILNKKIGDFIKIGESLATLHLNDNKKSKNATNSILKCVEISKDKPILPKLIYGIVDKYGYKAIE